MRKIKFRGKPMNKRGDCWDSDWFFGYLFPADLPNLANRFAICASNIESWSDFLLYEVHTDTIGQFTGIHDKHGKEIYEGDIIRFTKGQKKDSSGNWVDDTDDYVVCFDHGSFSIAGLSNCEDAIEIIGNIHEKTK